MEVKGSAKRALFKLASYSCQLMPHFCGSVSQTQTHTDTHTHTERERERERQTQTHRHTHQRKPHVDPKGGKRLDWHRGEKKLNNYLYYLNPYYLNTITRFTQRVEKT